MIEKGVRTLVFNQAHGPLLYDFLQALVAAGAPCTLCTGGDWEKRANLPAGVVVSAAPPLNRTSVKTRFFSWLAYSFSAVRLLLRCDEDVRVVFFSNPPILPFFGWLCSIVRRYRYSVVVYDIYPDVLVGMGVLGQSHLLARIWRSLNRVTYERAFAIVTLGDVMALALARQFNPAKTVVGNIIVSMPWVDTTLIRPRPRTDNPFAIQNTQLGHVTVLYSGNMGATHDMETILGAARLMESHAEVGFLLIGAGAGFHDLEMASRDLKNVSVLPWQPADQVPYIWAAAEIALVTLRPGIEQCSFPSKTPFALSAGCAIVGLTQVPSDLADVIDRTGCGVVVSPGNSGELARCLLTLAGDRALLEKLRAASRAAAENFFGSERNIAALLAGVPRPAAERTGDNQG